MSKFDQIYNTIKQAEIGHGGFSGLAYYIKDVTDGKNHQSASNGKIYLDRDKAKEEAARLNKEEGTERYLADVYFGLHVKQGAKMDNTVDLSDKGYPGLMIPKKYEIVEALSFNQTFKAPDLDEKIKRNMEIFNEILPKLEKTKLKDGTWHVHHSIDLEGKRLITLQGLNVSIVDGDFYCNDNFLTDLKGCPRIVEQEFDCKDNQLKSLDGCPVEAGDFKCYRNSVYFTKEDVKQRCSVKRNIIVRANTLDPENQYKLFDDE